MHCSYLFFFFFNDTATTEIYTLSLHDALPIFGEFSIVAIGRSQAERDEFSSLNVLVADPRINRGDTCEELHRRTIRSEEHTSELQSQSNLVCRLLLEKKKKPNKRSKFSDRPFV